MTKKSVSEVEGTREKLVNSARHILNEKGGYSALTMRSAAKAAGLSPGAPYRHFTNGFPELVATLALEGFEEMVKVLSRASKSTDARERILDVALAYVRFGVERPNMYRAMFSAQIAEPVETYDELFQKGELSFSSRSLYASVAQIKLEAFECIVAPLRDAQRSEVLKPGDPDTFGLALAALVHGLVGEFIDEGLGIRESQSQPWSRVRREMSRTVTELLLTGLE
jgi:AcrR family transcriptional regulator